MEIEMLLPFEQAVGDLPRWVDKEVSLQGRVIIADRDKSYIASSYEAFQHGECLPVDDGKQIAQQLLRTLPPFGGGDCIYDEEVVITGTVRRYETGLYLTDLRSCEVRRDGVSVAIQLVAQEL
jgi:hypothetical protein